VALCKIAINIQITLFINGNNYSYLLIIGDLGRVDENAKEFKDV